MITTVIFDMGGVILRTVDPTPRERMAEKLGCSRKELEALAFSGSTSIQSELGLISDMAHWRSVLDYFGNTNMTPESAYYEFFSGDEIDQELLNFIRWLKLKVKVGLLSNAWQNARVRLGALFKFIDDFDVSIFSGEVGVRKPEKAIFDLMLKKLGSRADQSIFIDDFQVNIQGAKEAGLSTILFKNNSQTIAQLKRHLNSS